MRLERLELNGFKSFAKKTTLVFDSPVVAIVGPNGSGKSNVAEACRWVLGEQSLKSLRGQRGEDFIWHGSFAAGRANRANVAITFDNRDQRLPLEAAEVEISREIYRDGTSDYLINQSPVRLKDLTELLHQVSLGSSGYHIISQGEADKILTSSPAARREIIETALGLRFYEWQLAETEKKLGQTDENLRQAELLRREIAPHLRWLKKEMEKVEKARELRRELKALALDYFSREQTYLAAERDRLDEVRRAGRVKLKQLTDRLSDLERIGEKENDAGRVERERLTVAEKRLRELVEKQGGLTRRLGWTEGLMEAKKAASAVSGKTVEVSRVSGWTRAIEVVVQQAINLADLNLIRAAWEKVKQIVAEMKMLMPFDEPPSDQTIFDLKKEQTDLTFELEQINKELVQAETEVKKARQGLEQEAVARGEAAAALVGLKFEVTGEYSKLEALAAEEQRLEILQADFDRELAEAAALTDRELLDSVRNEVSNGVKPGERFEQAARRRQIERFKIQLEEAGVGSNEVATEYQQVAAREGHLTREATDLKASIGSLEQVIKDLKNKIDQEFQGGLRRINREFQEFFTLLFGGGQAELTVVEIGSETSDQPLSLGLEIEVNLPRKRVRGLAMLSGGERSLTSIALLFALSRVHPPPFMILDETDAALDEANSKKYGDMVEALAKETQLILITHNRETMSRANVVYGVTMGADGVSRLLSIKFDEALSYAKG